MDLLTTLTLGAYGSYLLAWGLYRDLRDKIDNLMNNHIKHLEERIERLEEK